MREEYVKHSSEVDGVEVFDLGDEYVFSLKNKKGEDVEYHLGKPFKNEDSLKKYIEAKKLEIIGD